MFDLLNCDHARNIHNRRESATILSFVSGDRWGQSTHSNISRFFHGVPLQVQQKLTEHFSLNVFLDNLFQTPDISKYPSSEHLHAAGLGLSYRTLIGPLRLEYGRNLNPRPRDRNWAVHFSIGSPF